MSRRKKLAIGSVMLLIYMFVFGVLIFSVPTTVSDDYVGKVQTTVTNEYNNQESSDKVVLVESPEEGGIARINLIENAQSSIDVAYHTSNWDTSSEIFFGLLIEAADRGVEVRLVFDGILGNLDKDVAYVIENHPNMEMKYYEPFNILRPRTWNNRMHDKFIIVDEQIALLGGRNIADKYYASEGYEKGISNDRDVMVIDTAEEKSSVSGVYQLEQYFLELWDSEYSKRVKETFNEREMAQARENKQLILERLSEHKQEKESMFGTEIEWLEYAHDASNVILVHNPLTRGSKEPWVGYEINELLRGAEKSIVIQSPYIIPNKSMLEALNDITQQVEDVSILTNSRGSTPNFPAYAGYLSTRNDIIDSGVDIYEYQGTGDSIHGKSMIIDNRISVIGSFNVDMRSMHLSTETMFIIDSEGLANELNEAIDVYKGESLVVGEDYKYIENDEVEENIPSTFKNIALDILKYLSAPFKYML